MPLVRIALMRGKPEAYRRTIGDCVHDAMVEVITVPTKDRFQVITEHDSSSLIYDPEYLDINRSGDIVVIQIALSTGRSVDQKKALYARIAQLLNDRLGVRKEDVFINLVEVVKENWSFGNGIAQYA